MTHYRYTDRDLLEVAEHYHYSALQGPSFLDAYRAARLAVLDTLPERAGPAVSSATYPPEGDAVETDRVLSALENEVDQGWLDRLVQRFEVTKRLYPEYDARMRKPQGDACDLTRYARLACVLGDEVGRTGSLARLNTLLKLNDLLISQTNRDRIGAMLHRSITAELAAMAKLHEGVDDA